MPALSGCPLVSTALTAFALPANGHEIGMAPVHGDLFEQLRCEHNGQTIYAFDGIDPNDDGNIQSKGRNTMRRLIAAMAIAASVSMLLIIVTAENTVFACTIDGEPCNGDPESTAENTVIEPTSELHFPKIEALFDRLIAEKFGNAILMTDQDCSAFGEEWINYEPMSGRFPISSGSGTDDRGESMEFHSGDQGGEYRNVLTYGGLPRGVSLAWR